jgi:hypothetical protein
VEPNDRPEEAATLPAEFCVSGRLVESSDQELYFWEVAPEDGMITWAFTVRGVPATITSAHLLRTSSALGTLPLGDVSEQARADSDAHLGTAPVTSHVRLAPGPYLVGISRGVEGYGQSLIDDRDYWIAAVRAGSLPPAGDLEPNDDASVAAPVADAFTLSGELGDGLDVFRWTPGTAEAASLWSLRATTSKGSPLTLELGTADGIVVLSATGDPDGVATLHDVSLAPGESIVRVSSYPDGPQPYTLEASPVTDAFADAEPNDQAGQELPLSVGDGVASGRLATDLDVDRYAFSVDSAMAGASVDLDLSWPEPLRRTLCLYTAEGTQVGCPQGDVGIAWHGLLLPPGGYVLTVSGFGDLEAPYELTVSPGAAMPGPGDVEPNDDASTANPVAGSFELSGDLAGTGDVFAWTVGDEDASRAWRIELSSTPGAPASVGVYRPDGTFLAGADTSTAGAGSVLIPDLRLPAGSYELWLKQVGSAAPAYVLRVVEETAGVFDAEPNDVTGFAIPLDSGTRSARGRLARDADVDMYAFDVDEGLSASLVDISLAWSDGQLRLLCLGSDVGSQVQCREGRTGTALTDLLLAPGRYTLAVSGAADLNDPYTVSVAAAAAPSADRESEPNDRPEAASTWDPALLMHGQARNGDWDTYRVPITGEPQLWRLEVAGEHIGQPEWLQPDGTHVGTPVLAADGTRAIIEDLHLVPGEHRLTVSAEGEYTMTLTPLGPPDLAAEHEPNDDADHAAVLRMQGTRTGRLATAGEVDVYRFSLEGTDHVVVTAAPPVDGSIGLEITSAGSTVAAMPAPTKGAPSVIDVMLPQGDYQLWLRPYSASAGSYEVDLMRADPFAPPGASGPQALDATLTVTVETDEIAAFLPFSQRVPATLEISNGGSRPLELMLEAASSHGRWAVELPDAPAVVEAGATVELPLTIAVADDASSDVPVRVTVRARDASGAQATAFTEIVPTPTADAVDPVQAWSVPDELLGGLDVASAALGATAVGEHFHEWDLHDGVTIAGLGAGTSIQNGPDSFGVDLAGDEPVPVAGIALDPLAGDGTLAPRPRAFELLLSLDGTTYMPALSGELGPQTVTQYFVLPEPVPARFAQLRIDSSWAETPGSVNLGEWKVIAVPGVAPTNEPLDIADTVRGGHGVWTDTLWISQLLSEMLDPMLDPRRTLWLEVGQSASWVMGFWTDRAARIERLEWVDPAGTVPAERLDSVEVSVSTDSSLGPWRSLGIWQLERTADGSVAPFILSEPSWARFVHFSWSGPLDAGAYRELPGTIRIFEQASGDEYRSILGEWGQADPRAIFERLEPPAMPTTSDGGDDAGDTPEEATPLEVGMERGDRAARREDVDWYALTVPEGDNTLELVTRTTRAGDVRLRLVDATGLDVPVTSGPLGDGGAVSWTAVVQPGATYRAEVVQPILSVFVTFDTSGSVWPWFPALRSALREFAAGVTPGLEAVQILPFDGPAILEAWSDQPFLISSAVDGWAPDDGSSAMAAAIMSGLGELEERDGAKAILVLGDAVGGGFEAEGGKMADRLAAVQPAIFSVHLGGTDDPYVSTAIMHDLAATNGGYYQYAVSQSDLDRTFARMATWMRRPADYALSYTTSLVDYAPSSLSVVPAEGASVPLGGGISVELVLDTSGSMNKRIDGVRRMDIAQAVLTRLVGETLPEGLPVALRTFKAARGSCDTVMEVPFSPLDRATMSGVIADLRINPKTRTPLGATLHAVGEDLAGTPGPKIVVFVTDGKETCKGDPEAEVARLVELGIDVTMNIVGLALDDPALKADMQAWAAEGGGVFFDAQDQESLLAAVAATLQAPFRVFDRDGTLVVSGVVGGAGVTLPVGTYRVEVLSEPLVTFEPVEVPPGTGVVLTVPPETLGTSG